MPAQDSDHIVRFAAFELDLKTVELRRSGVRLPVQGRPLQVLAVLLRTPGQLVTSEQLRAELWPADTFVDFEHGVRNAVARLRAILGDSADKPRYIETLPRRGYRFIGALVETGANPVPIVIQPVTTTEHPVPARRSDRPSEPPTHRWTTALFAFASLIAVSRPVRQMPWLRPVFLISLASVPIATATWFFEIRPRSAPIPSVAVIPFLNLDPAPDTE